MAFATVVKGWKVECKVDLEDGGWEKRFSRVYHVQSAADEYAAILKKSTKYPASVVVRTVQGLDDSGIA